MSTAFKRVSILALATAAVLGSGIGFLAVSTMLSRGAETPGFTLCDCLAEDSGCAPDRCCTQFELDNCSDDSLDPNDCSRGIDEANQEACGEDE